MNTDMFGLTGGITVTGDLVDGLINYLQEDVASRKQLNSRHGSFIVKGVSIN